MSLCHLVQSVRIEDLSLSEDEMRAYPRWYTDLLLRRGNESIKVDDIMTFLENFMDDQERQQLLEAVEYRLETLDPSQFYAFVRLAGHVLEGKHLDQHCIYQPAGVPQPRSILSRKRKQLSSSPSESTTNEPTSAGPGNPFRKQDKKLDIDSFTTFMLTGNRPGADQDQANKRKKRVTFDDSPPQVAEAAARSMEELMRQRGMNAPAPMYHPVAPSGPAGSATGPGSSSAPSVTVTEEDEPEEEVEISSNFQNVNIDSVLHHGVSNVAPTPDFDPNLSPSPSPSPQPQLGGPQANGGAVFQQQGQNLVPQHTLQPQMSGLQPQISGNQPIQPQISGHQPQTTGQPELSRFAPLQPTPTGSLNNSSSSLLMPPTAALTPQQQFLQTMSPHRTSPSPQSSPSVQSPQPTGNGQPPPPPPPPPPPREYSSQSQFQAQPQSQFPAQPQSQYQAQPQAPAQFQAQSQSQFQPQSQRMAPPPPPPPRANSNLPSIPPPPPQPRRNASGGSYLRPAPPPPRARASSSPIPSHQQQQAAGAQPHTQQFYQQDSYYPQLPPQQNTSAPDLLSNLKALQDEVDRIRRQ